MRSEIRRRLARLLAAVRTVLAALRRRGVDQVDEHEGASEEYAAQLHTLNRVADDLVDLDGDARQLHDELDAWEARWTQPFADLAARLQSIADRLAEAGDITLPDVVPPAPSLDWALTVTYAPVEPATADSFAQVMEIATGERELVHA